MNSHLHKFDRNNRVIRGINPGTINCGCSFLTIREGKVTRIKTELIKAEGKFKIIERVMIIGDKIRDLVTKVLPDEVAVESLIYVKNPKALMALAQARGAILSALGKNYVDRIYEYSPNLAKSIVTGHGHADKEMVQKSLSLSLGVNLTFSSYDESDALLLSMGHWYQTKNWQPTTSSEHLRIKECL